MALATTCLWASLADVKPWLKLAVTDVQHDTVLDALCNAITEELEQATSRIFITRSITETLDGTGTSQMHLIGYPVTAVSSFTNEGTAVPTADYHLDSAAGILKRDSDVSVWEAGTANYAITYTAGYARASLPARVVQTGLELLRHRYADWAAGADTVTALSMGGQSYTPRSTWPYQVRDAIDALRHEYRVAVR